MKFGSEVHVAFEQVGWVDEATPDLPPGDAGRLVADLLEAPNLRPLFERGGQAVELFREQAVDAVLDGKWLSGVIDRLHLHRDASGVVNRVRVIDFKTDGLDDITELVARYSGQMQAYREVMEQAYPAARVECVLVSTRRREHISI
jgi:ATP-dependent exoDNAse (exonuclease V) beta subunit